MSTATTKMKTRRAGHRGVLTKLLKKVKPSSDELLQKYDVSELSTIRGLIVKKQETIDQLNEKIVEELSEDEVSEKIEEADRYTYDIEMAVTKLSKIIKESEITAKQSKSRELMTNAGLNLRTWKSNSNQLSDEATKANVLDKDSQTKILGMRWDAKSDILTFAKQNEDRIDIDNSQATKREVLRKSSSIYDPLGILGPVTVRAKLLIQTLWKEGYNWDQVIPNNIVKSWCEILDDIRDVTVNTKIARHYFNDENENESNEKITLHVFVDASQRAYKAILWSDSQIVLHWILSSKTFGRFVQNRVLDIKETTQNYDWKYVPTESNTADLQTRGISSTQFKESTLWMQGPSWISNENSWRTWTPQVKQETLLLTTTDDSKNREPCELNGISKIIDLSRFSSLKKLLRVTCYVLKFVNECKSKRPYNLRKNARHEKTYYER
ncbi:unnamed protein product [Mytilus coruscus]|uniref:Uncharacterized protein n=1 Tax=Mytilus coruscus TaxID=42192 RepID=A0A6J8E2J4_MYTCO|nr:unnamed protein product [Mytilus coruscus]